MRKSRYIQKEGSKVAEQFYTIMTDLGLAAFANATIMQTDVDFAKIAVGDGNGGYYTPTKDMTSLRNKVWEGAISSVSIDEDNENRIVVVGVIPSEVGGFTIREIGIFDKDNALLAIGKMPETYKPVLAQGSAKDLYLEVILEVTNASSVVLKVDPTFIYASKKYVDEQIVLKVQPLEQKMTNIEQSISNVQQQVTEHLEETKKWVTVAATQTQSIANDTNVDIFWSSIESNNNADFASIRDGKILLEKGVYQVHLFVVFDANGEGVRYVNVEGVLDGRQAANASYHTPVSICVTIQKNTTEILLIKVNQSSGSALNIIGGNIYAQIVKVADLS